MTSTSSTSSSNNNNNKLFHTYENFGYIAEQQLANNNSSNLISHPLATNISNSIDGNENGNMDDNCNNNDSLNSNNGSFISPGFITGGGGGGGGASSGNAVNKTAIESPFADPIITHHAVSNSSSSQASQALQTAKILSTTDSTGFTRMLTAASSSSSHNNNNHHHHHHHRVTPSQNLVTKLITFPAQSPMDSLKDWSVSTFKCTKQLINEKRGICPVTNDSQLQNDIEQLRENRNKLLQMLRHGTQMSNHYSQLVRTQQQLHALMNEMSIKCFTTTNSLIEQSTNNNNSNSSSRPSSKQVVANFSSLGNNLSSTTTTSPTRHHHHHHHHHHHPHPKLQQPKVTASINSNAELHSFEEFLPVLNYMKSSFNLNLVDDFKKNAITLNAAIKNGEKLLAALNFFCSNLSTLIYKTIEDTLTTVKQYELARLEYDAEKNSLNYMSPAVQTSMTFSSEKLELARMRYEQLKEDVQIKMRFLEENTIKVMHKQLLVFNGAFASYTTGNTAALDATLKQFSIKETNS